MASGWAECSDKQHFMRAYQKATVGFSSAVMLLNQKIRTTPKDEYERLARAVDEARPRSEQARRALEQHIAVHHC
jgi:hypothetical protein